MKQQLRQIYTDLSQGKLSQEEALEKIKAVKLGEQTRALGELLATPVWQMQALNPVASDSTPIYTQHHILLCGPVTLAAQKLAFLLPSAYCGSVRIEGDQSIAEYYNEVALECFKRIQNILCSKPRGKVLVQVAVAGDPEQALLAGLSGLLKTAALENPQLLGKLIMVPVDTKAEEVAQLLLKETAHTHDTLIRYGHGIRQVLRWQEAQATSEKLPIVFKNDGVYLITGGLGSLGLIFTKEILAQAPGARVVLTGRSVFDAHKQALLADLALEVRRAEYRQVDFSSLDQVRKLISTIGAEYGELSGILHCAGMIADNFILKKPDSEFSEVLKPKVTGTYNLDLATQNVKLDFFVLFSSVAGAMGNVGQADYAAANGFMDQFAAHRNRLVAAKQRYGRTCSINWGLWQAGGMHMDAASQEMLQQATGVQPMQTDTGIRALYRSIALPYDQVLVLEGDVGKMRTAVFPEESTQKEDKPAQATPESLFRDKATAVELDRASLEEETQEYLCKQFSELLRLPYNKIDPEAALEEYGIDSILAMKLTSHMEKTFGSLSKTLFFEYQTIRELTTYFIRSHVAQLQRLFAADRKNYGGTKAAQPEPESSVDAGATRRLRRRFGRVRNLSLPTAAPDPIAIIGLSGRYPEAANLEEYWRNLSEGKDCIREVPKERWDWKEY
ncbi:MAG: SDR family NAD(P)-dependent oxidoreductase, partial [Candidatus Angelobacter sp.]